MTDTETPGIFTTVEYAEAAGKPYDLDSLYIPLVDECDNRYLATVLHIDSRHYHTGWRKAIPATQDVIGVTVNDERTSGNPPMVKE